MNRKIFLIMTIVLGALMMVSCKSKEEKVIDSLKSITEKVEKEGGSWNSEQWDKAINEIEEINNYAQTCNFSSDQIREMGRLEGRLSGALIQAYSKAFASELGVYMEAAGAFLDGLDESAGGLFDDFDFDFDDGSEDFEITIDETPSASEPTSEPAPEAAQENLKKAQTKLNTQLNQLQKQLHK